MIFTDSPLDDFDRHCIEEEKFIKRLPECADCGEKIQDDKCYLINDEPICKACMEQYEVYTTDLMME